MIRPQADVVGLTIRPVEDGDIGSLIALWGVCELTRPWNDPLSDIAHARATEHASILLGFSGYALVASVMVGYDGHRGWVYYLAVDPVAQNRGHGRAMMAAAEAWLSERGAPALRLMVRDANSDALRFYKALGFERQDVVVLGKRLGASPA